MKERPILFSAPMVRAILAGTKMHTRRLVKVRDKELHDDTDFLHGGSAEVALGHGSGSIGEFREQDGRWFGLTGWKTVCNIACPYGKPGDRLWVRESFQALFADGIEERWQTNYKTGEGYKVYYMATDARQEFIDGEDDTKDTITPSIFMPRWASRITLEVVSVRVERLQDISEADALEEGVPPLKTAGGLYDWTVKPRGPVGDFQALWESINGADSWDANPWVWVIEFKRLNP